MVVIVLFDNKYTKNQGLAPWFGIGFING